MQTERGLPDIFARFRGFQRSELLDEMGQVNPIHELHRDVRTAVDLPGVEDSHDIRVLEGEGRFDLALIALTDHRGREQDGADNLDRDWGVIRDAPAAINLPHSSLADLVGEDI